MYQEKSGNPDANGKKNGRRRQPGPDCHSGLERNRDKKVEEMSSSTFLSLAAKTKSCQNFSEFLKLSNKRKKKLDTRRRRKCVSSQAGRRCPKTLQCSRHNNELIFFFRGSPLFAFRQKSQDIVTAAASRTVPP
jgi:hypothetical protein